MMKALYLILALSSIFPIGACEKQSNNQNVRTVTAQINSSTEKGGVQVKLEKFVNFYNSIKDLDSYNLDYNSAERRNFKRFPGARKGVQITDLSSLQRIQFQDILNDLLSGQGYLKLIGILSNEDASARADDELGREKYWLTFFGVPVESYYWGFRFEGHHASFNFSFRGDQLISSTPFIIGTDPSIMQNGKWSPLTKEDEFREGYNVLFEEEDLALDFILELSEENYDKGLMQLDSGIDLICEDNEVLNMETLYHAAKVEGGLLIAGLSTSEQKKFGALTNVYFSNLRSQKISVAELIETNTKLIFNGDLQKNGRFYYRIINEDFVIEFQNIGNHIHCMLRSFKNDFGGN